MASTLSKKHIQSPENEPSGNEYAQVGITERPYTGNSWVELSQSAYRQNLTFFREQVGHNTELSVVVKANAYGHGWQSIARLAVQAGADSFCVHSLDEALKLRRAGFSQNILIMGHVPLDRLSEVVYNNLRMALFNRESLIRLKEITGEGRHLARVHLKLETGTYRHGIDAADLEWFLNELKGTPRIILEAAYTHFANIEDSTDQEYAEYQQYAFKHLAKIVKKSGFPILRQHTACTAAILLFPETHMEMVRLGLGQYGYWSSPQTLASAQEKFGKASQKTPQAGFILENPRFSAQDGTRRQHHWLWLHLSNHPENPDSCITNGIFGRL